MGNHNIGRAFAAAAEAFWAGVPDGAATREMALAALDAAGAEYHRSDAEFGDEVMDQTTPLGRLVALAFDATPGELVTEADDYDDDAWVYGPVARFDAHFDFH